MRGPVAFNAGRAGIIRGLLPAFLLSMSLRDHELKAKDSIFPLPIQPDVGVGWEFTNKDGKRCVSVCRDARPRRASLVISSYVGVSPDAFHCYARIQFFYSLSYKIIATGKIEHVSGYGDDCKPEQMQGLEVEITRPNTRRDVQHYKDHNEYHKGTFMYRPPKLSERTYQFWTRKEAVDAAVKWFHENTVGWRLSDDHDCDRIIATTQENDDILLSAPDLS